MGDDRGIFVSNKELYDEFLCFRRDWDQWKGKHDEQHKSFTRTIETSQKRIRSLELKFYGILAGLVAAIGLIVSGKM